MWLIENNTFISDEYLQAQKDMSSWRKDGNLTIILGNGPTRSATYLNSLRQNQDSKDVGWENAVRNAAKHSKIDEKFLFGNQNLLALAQAIFEKMGEKKARKLLVDQLGSELLKPLRSTFIHDLIVKLSPSAIVTTNYDLQIERAFTENNQDWFSLVRNVGTLPDHSGIPIFKMHGTLSPDLNWQNNYFYTSAHYHSHPEESIVIFESDYDDCLKELQSKNESLLFRALENPCLIIGKSFAWQDLSFLYALRFTRKKRDRRAYLITPSLSTEEKLNLHNLGITPLVINLPSSKEDGHFYVGFVKAMLELFPEYQKTYQKGIMGFAHENNLIRAPHIVALGLAAYNLMGRIRYGGSMGNSTNPQYILPSTGRRSLRLEAKGYAGGSALTALGIFATLDWEKKFQPSIISPIGQDIYRQVILDFCEKNCIDVDGLSDTAANTWQSTVLIHESETHDKRKYPGQRIFLDRDYEGDITLSKEVEAQFEAQLDHKQPNLKLVYFDKFLALPYPFNPNDMEREGLLMKNEHLLEEIVSYRKDVDILYETGGGGSIGLVVEKRLGKYINIFTAGFPFFVRHILSDNTRKANAGLKRFSRDDDWFKAEFEEETRAIEDIFNILDISPYKNHDSWFTPPQDWIDGGNERTGREHSRRWMIVTLHHYGAFVVDLNAGIAHYCPTPFDPERTENTAGAGDAFRGAFCYALLQLDPKFSQDNQSERNLLLACTNFANKIAFEKCGIYDMNEAYQKMGELSKKYLPV